MNLLYFFKKRNVTSIKLAMKCYNYPNHTNCQNNSVKRYGNVNLRGMSYGLCFDVLSNTLITLGQRK